MSLIKLAMKSTPPRMVACSAPGRSGPASATGAASVAAYPSLKHLPRTRLRSCLRALFPREPLHRVGCAMGTRGCHCSGGAMLYLMPRDFPNREPESPDTPCGCTNCYRLFTYADIADFCDEGERSEEHTSELQSLRHLV